MVSAATFVPFPKSEVGQTLPRRFASQVALHSDRIAVKAEDGTRTYAQLDSMANRLAAAIIKKIGTKAEPAALLFEPGAMMVVAVLAVLKAGKFWVPLEPSAPVSRNRQILDEVESRLIITHGECIETANKLLRRNTMNCDELPFNAESVDDVDLSVSPHSLASVIYTSGSTGKPKGVMLAHRNVLHNIYLQTNSPRISADDRLSMCSPYHVVAGSTAVFRALLNGAMVLPFNLKARGVGDLAKWLEEEEITIFQAVPSAFRSLVDSVPPDQRFPEVRLIHLGGEPVLARDVAAYRKHFPDHCILLNNLGSTEVGPYRQFFITKETPIDDSVVPVGHPVEDKEIVLLERDEGDVGEITVKSAYLSPGYWRRPDLTASAFMPDPDGGDKRIFRTGDLGRMQPDGCLQHLGRRDHQVKIRGYRIETGDIEAVLLKHPAIKQAGVIVGDDRHGDKKLIAYFASPDCEMSGAALRSFVADLLPDYMIPSTFVRLEVLPVTPGGKVDRKALPAPEFRSEESFVAPRTPNEQALAAIWAEVLKLNRIGIHDNFFDLGGHSLLATHVISRVRTAFNIELPLRALFEAPTVAELSLKTAKICSDKGKRHGSAPITRRRPGDIVPCSLPQLRLWFLDQFEPGIPLYNVCAALRIKGALNVRVLEACFNEIVCRHEVLRTTFSCEGNQPLQVIHAPGQFKLEVIDLSDLPSARREAEALRLAFVEAGYAFDLYLGPLIRVSLIRLFDATHVLVINIHHIVSDRSSLSIFYRELSALYEANCAGKPSRLLEPPVQYADYAIWQRDWLAGETLDQQIAYWKRQLQGAPALLELPADCSRPASQSFEGAHQTHTLSEPLLAGVKRLSWMNRSTLFMMLLAAFNALLARYTRSDDIVIGSPIAGRTRSETENLIGFFVNTLALRTDCSGDPIFVDLISRVRETCLQAYAHQDLPFEKLVEELNPERSLSYSPLFQVMFALQNMELEIPALTELEVTSLGRIRDTAKFDLLVFAYETEHGLDLVAEYNSDLFKEATITRFLSHYEALLEGIVANPEAKLSQLPLLTDAERKQLLIDWNDTEIDYPKQRCVHQFFEAQVDETPDAVSVVFEDQQLSYAQLNRLANRLAHLLIALGVGPEVLVALCVERSIEMVIGLLGILKAGGAYLPLDPTYPKERRAFMLEDSKATVLITESKLNDELPKHAAQCIFIDQAEAFNRYPVTNPETNVASGHLAYVIYTSGSTGKPKGVAIEHCGLINLLCAMRDETAMTGDDALLAVTTLSFDIAALELYLPLIIGARLILASREDASDGARLARRLRDSGATVMQATPATWRLLIGSGWQGGGRLNLLCGGEALSRELADQLLERCQGLTNLYGPTEATVWSTDQRVAAGKRAIPLGRPIANTQVYLLDPHLNPVPIGVPGELHIGGAGLARGYLNRPELTAEKFIPHPFQENSRLYKTGDLARYRQDGQIEFLGRLDHQVKLRGYRIELGEIEATLVQHPRVREAVVVAREDTPGDTRLVAYAVPGLASEDAAPEPELEADHVSQWETVFDNHVYGESSRSDQTFNISLWTSSYTGTPIAENEMREWLDDAVTHILSMKPRRVLELGCGTGLLLFAIAPHCERYLGSDISQEALDYINKHLDKIDNHAVELFHSAADDVSQIAPHSIDAVILNSVVQYFPDIEYLVKVIERVLLLLAPGGCVFLGDLRSLPLLESLHTSVQLYKAQDELPIAQLRQRVQLQLTRENELVIDPAFFLALKQYLPQIGQVDILAKRGRAHNELTRFRYQVIFRLAAASGVAPDPLNWRQEGLTVALVEQSLAQNKPQTLTIAEVPNARLATEVETMRLLANPGSLKTAGDLKRALNLTEDSSVDPEVWYALAGGLGYEVAIDWAGHDARGCYDVVFSRAGSPRLTLPRPQPPVNKPWRAYGNHPLRGRMTANLVTQLRSLVQDQLPDYMMPSAFVLLDALPLTPNGKLNRKALPAPDQSRPELTDSFVSPRTPNEQTLAAIWAEVLKLEKIGIHDNFFDLGGHSLLATQVISRVKKTFQADIQLRALFESPTVAGLSELIVQKQAEALGEDELAQLLIEAQGQGEQPQSLEGRS